MSSHLDNLRQACAAPLNHPDRASLDVACQSVAAYLLDEFTNLPGAPIGQTATRTQMEALLRAPPPEQGMPFSQALAEVRERVAPFNFRPNHPRFLAFIPGAPSFVSVLGDWLCSGLNLFAGVWKEAAGAAQVELVVLDWFKDWLGYPQAAQGLLTSGGSEANLTALVVARERLPWTDRQRAVLYASDQRHWSIDRAAMVAGLRPDQVRKLAGDAEGRLSPAALYEAVLQDAAAGQAPWLVVANAGATNTGVIDPLADLATLCQAHKLWLHVDAAYGWPAALTDEGKRSLRGIEEADSVTLDPHKWFGQTFEAGCLLVRDGALLSRTFHMRPEYMQDVTPRADEVNFCDHGIALTRRFRALKIWLSVQVLGVAWFRRLVDHCCALADFAQALLAAAGCFEILSPRRLSIVCFRYVSGSSENVDLDMLNLGLCEELAKTGIAFISTTRLGGQAGGHGPVALRFCFVNWRTTAADVEEIVALVERLGAMLARNH